MIRGLELSELRTARGRHGCVVYVASTVLALGVAGCGAVTDAKEDQDGHAAFVTPRGFSVHTDSEASYNPASPRARVVVQWGGRMLSDPIPYPPVVAEVHAGQVLFEGIWTVYFDFGREFAKHIQQQAEAHGRVHLLCWNGDPFHVVAVNGDWRGNGCFHALESEEAARRLAQEMREFFAAQR